LVRLRVLTLRPRPASAEYAQTFIEFPPMQKGASFNLEQVKEELQKKMQSQGPQ
jgi:arylsulfatase